MESSENNNEEILIVEDSPTQAEKLKFLLEEKRYRVSVAYNGQEALNFLMDKPRPTVIISDIVMPEMDGYQLCRFIKENKDLKDIPFILLTALSDPRDIIKGLECGADNFITKPYDEKYLLSRIQYVLANKVILETDKVQTGVEIFFGGQKYYITAQRQQILSLLLSTYETAVQTNFDLLRTQDELRATNEQLQQDITERKRAEEALLQSEEHFRSIIENSFDIITILDSEGILLYTSPSGERILGYKAEEVSGKNIFDFIHPEDRKNVTKIFAGVVQTPGSSGSIDFRFTHKNGSWLNLESVGKSILNTSGGVNVVINTRDITERKNIEDALQESEKRLIKAQKLARMGFLDWKLKTDEIYLSDEVYSMYGLVPEEKLAARDLMSKIVHPDDLEFVGRNLELAARDEKPCNIDHRVVLPDGSIIWVNAQTELIRGADGQPETLLGTVLDITERKQTEEALRRSEEMYWTIAESANDSIFIVNRDDKVEYVNSFAASMAGIKPDEAIGKPRSDFLPSDESDRLKQKLNEVFDTGMPVHDETNVRFHDHENWLDTKLVPLINGMGEVNAVLGISRDISELKMIEKTLRYAEAKYRGIFENATEGIFQTSADGRILSANPAVAHMLGYTTPQELMANVDNVKKIYMDLDRGEEFARQIQISGEVKNFEIKLGCKDGSEKWFSLSARGLKDAGGELIGFEGLIVDITERKKVEKERSRLISIIEATSDFVSTGYSDGRVLYYNKAARRMLGIGENAEISNIRIPHTHPDWANKIIQEKGIPTAIKEGIWNGETALMSRDGREIPVSQVIISHRTPDGRVDYISTIMRDMTERKRAEEALRLSEEKYRTLTEAAQEAIFIVDRDDKIEFVNKFAADMLSLPPQEIIGKSRHSLFPSDTSEEQKRGLQQIFVTGMSDHYETKVRFPKYEMWLDTQLVPLKNEKGEVNAMLGISRDISKRKLAELEREQFFKFFRISTDLMCIADPNGCFKKVNPACLNTLGYTEAELLAKPFIDFVHPDDRQATLDDLANQLRIGSSLNFENRYICKDGKTRWFSWRANYVADEGITYATARDITESKLSEEKLSLLLEELKRSNTELEQFAYIASHDLQEPLRMVGSYVQLIERRYKGKLDQEADDFIAFAVDGAKRMQNMINDLLQYSRVTTRGKPFERTDCQILLDVSLTNLKIAIEESNALVTHDPLPVVFADPSQLDRVFQNLLGNSIKFRGENPPRVHIGVEKKGTDWVFSVKDNGIGFDMQQANRLFQMFQRLQGGGKYPGTGMGLAICRKIVERHGGRIWAESEAGKGATFYFTIPVIDMSAIEK